MRALFNTKNYEGLREILAENPGLANEGIPYDEHNLTKAHPLHRLADAVFSGYCTDIEAVEMAKILLSYGADINGGQLLTGKDTPLIAAASLHADALALFYIDQGADIKHAGTHGGTALHWAGWCGRPAVVKRLLEEGAEINKLCIDFKSTPLFWAVHGLKADQQSGLAGHLESVRLLILAGGDKSIPNKDGKSVADLAGDDDRELREILT